MPSEREQKVYDVLERLGVSYVRYEHPPVFTVDQAKKYWGNVSGAHCKNLFLRNNRGNRHYMIILELSKQADLTALAKKLGEYRFRFAYSRRLVR